MTYEQSVAKVKAYEARREALSAKEKAFFDKLDAVDIGNCGVSFGDFINIANLHENNAIDASTMFFRLGFLKGQRAAQKAKRGAAR